MKKQYQEKKYYKYGETLSKTKKNLPSNWIKTNGVVVGIERLEWWIGLNQDTTGRNVMTTIDPGMGEFSWGNPPEISLTYVGDLCKLTRYLDIHPLYKL